ncbi:MAG TPA: hypothetical protein VMW48_13255 [Vicinamibacterales bacterium]|nr:hypothetical protein [Vicinamibacterales bacterium]
MTMFSRHLDAAALGAAVLGDTVDPRVDAHLGSCARCRREHDRIAAILNQARAGADEAVDAAFAPADLDRQREAILHRIARTGGIARVLRFPNGLDDRPLQSPPAQMRWLLAAAAAGLIIGVAAGQVPHLYNAARRAPATAEAGRSAPPAQDADWSLDDTLLSEVDAALDSRSRPELGALDALTPVHYETR